MQQQYLEYLVVKERKGSVVIPGVVLYLMNKKPWMALITMARS